jgi:preprotein translocase subunit SecE
MFKKIIQFFKEIKTELTRVTWPGRKEVINSTIVVLTTVFLISLFLWVVDLALQKFISQVI